MSTNLYTSLITRNTEFSNGQTEVYRKQTILCHKHNLY